MQSHLQQIYLLEIKKQTCFNHTTGVPTMKDRVQKPMFDYEKLLFKFAYSRLLEEIINAMTSGLKY
jgi:hypothetical protein